MTRNGGSGEHIYGPGAGGGLTRYLQIEDLVAASDGDEPHALACAEQRFEVAYALYFMLVDLDDDVPRLEAETRSRRGAAHRHDDDAGRLVDAELIGYAGQNIGDARAVERMLTRLRHAPLPRLRQHADADLRDALAAP